MAKTYLSTVKYEILAKYEVSGVIEKPDMVGAIFGQSEGLLGEDMDLKELQQSGKIGRIEVTVKKGKGTTFGEIIVPSSLDQVKTSILGATIETVEKVGPFDAKVKVIKISDTRKEKRDVITDRAKELLKHMQKFEGVESSEMADEIKTEIRTEKIVALNGMPAGPEAETSPEIIVVEGRADVLKLLSYGINNAVAMNGANIDAPLIDLCKKKDVTVLIDGDRGGELNVKKLASLTKVDYIARAPDGKEVEELTQKEILQSLKRRQSPAEAFSGNGFSHSFAPRQESAPRGDFQPRNDFGPRQDFSPRPRFNDRGNFGRDERPRFGDRGGFGHREDRGFGDRRGGFGRDERPRFGDRGGFNGGQGRFDRPRFNDRGGFRGNERFGGGEGQGFGGAPRFGAPQGSFEGGRPSFQQEPRFGAPAQGAPAPQFSAPTHYAAQQTVPKEVLDLKGDFDKMKGKLKARLLDEKGKKVKDVDVKELLTTLEKSKKNIGTIMFDGIVTKRLVEAAEKKGATTIIGARKGAVSSDKVKIYTM